MRLEQDIPHFSRDFHLASWFLAQSSSPALTVRGCHAVAHSQRRNNVLPQFELTSGMGNCVATREAAALPASRLHRNLCPALGEHGAYALQCLTGSYDAQQLALLCNHMSEPVGGGPRGPNSASVSVRFSNRTAGPLHCLCANRKPGEFCTPPFFARQEARVKRQEHAAQNCAVKFDSCAAEWCISIRESNSTRYASTCFDVSEWFQFQKFSRWVTEQSYVSSCTVHMAESQENRLHTNYHARRCRTNLNTCACNEALQMNTTWMH